MDLSELAKEYHLQCQASDEAIEFYKALGIGAQSIEDFKLGWISTPLIDQHRVADGKPIVPYIAVGGRVTQIRFSAFDFDMMEMYTSGVIGRDFPLSYSDYRLYNVQHAMPGLRTNAVVLNEDLLSSIRLIQEGYRAVTVPGYENFNASWYEMFRASELTVVVSEQRHDKIEEFFDGLKHRGISFRIAVTPNNYHLAHAADAVEEPLNTYLEGALEWN